MEELAPCLALFVLHQRQLSWRPGGQGPTAELGRARGWHGGSCCCRRELVRQEGVGGMVRSSAKVVDHPNVGKVTFLRDFLLRQCLQLR